MPEEIFVFGSNLAGRHGKGAALFAKNYHNAKYGVGIGRTGNAYAIPTKDENLRTLSLGDIKSYINDFLRYATNNQDLVFKVTRIGCGLAGYKDEQIAPMFSGAPSNCNLPSGWDILCPINKQEINNQELIMAEQKYQGPKIQDLNKFTLFADIPGVQNQRARLSWSLRGGNPRISAFAFNSATGKNEISSAPLPPDAFLVFFDQFQKMVESGQNNVKAKVACLTGIRDTEGKLTQEKRLLSELWFGVDEAGLAWVSVVEGEKPRIKFTFNIWGYTVIYKADGSPLTESEASKLCASSVIKALRSIYTANMAEFAEYSPAAARAATTAVTEMAAPKIDPSVLEDINF